MAEKLWRFVDGALRFVLVKVFRLSFLEARWQDLTQFVKFGLVGLSNTLVTYVVYLIGVGAGLHYLLASVVGYVVGIVNSFYWNNKYVFAAGGQQRDLLRSFCKTFVAYAGTGLVLNNILLYLEVDLLGWSKQIAPLINLLITIPVNFILNKLWAFKDGHSGGKDGS